MFYSPRTHAAINQNAASLQSSLLSQTLPKSNPSTQNTTLHILSFTYNKSNPDNTFPLVYVAIPSPSKLYQEHLMIRAKSEAKIGNERLQKEGFFVGL